LCVAIDAKAPLLLDGDPAELKAAAARGVASVEERSAGARAVLESKAAVTKLESDAFGGNVEVMDAWGRFTAATAHLRDVRSRFQRALQQDPSDVAASAAVQEARERALRGDEQLAAARLELSAARDRVRNKEAARQQLSKWTKCHALPEPP
jgi:hypothetical protein